MAYLWFFSICYICFKNFPYILLSLILIKHFMWFHSISTHINFIYMSNIKYLTLCSSGTFNRVFLILLSHPLWHFCYSFLSSIYYNYPMLYYYYCKKLSLRLVKKEADQDGGEVRCLAHLLPQKNTSTCKMTHTEHLVNAGRRT